MSRETIPCAFTLELIVDKFNIMIFGVTDPLLSIKPEKPLKAIDIV